MRSTEGTTLPGIHTLRVLTQRLCQAMQNIINERRMLEELDHPFICNMRYAFQDDENLFFVLDLMLGGDLRCKPSVELLC
jgi:serine/threonine kinase 32